MSDSKLESVAKVITVLSSLSVPIVIGVIGWMVQQTIAENSLRKDYTDMALRVLSQSETSNDKELRNWAVDILDKNAPLPFSAKVRQQLLGSGIIISKQLEFQLIDKLMNKPLEWVEPPKDGFKTDKALNDNYAENRLRAKTNAVTLSFLQNQVVSFIQSQKELEAQFQHDDVEFRKKQEDLTNK